MILREAMRIALHGLNANRLRSVLTMLGIIIGVAAVILLVAIGRGAQSSVYERIQPLANLITIVPSVGNVPGGSAPKDLIDSDAVELQKKIPDAVTVIPAITGQALAETDITKFRSRVVGSTEHWLEVNNRDLQVGSFFDAAQAHSTARVVVLGTTVADSLFGSPAAALSQSVRISRQTFRVIGVMQPAGQPDDNDAVIPLSTARRYIFGGGDKLNQIIVQVSQTTAIPAAEDEVIHILSDRHQIKDPTKRDFEVRSLRSRLDTFNEILRITFIFTTAVAAISLLVGGIGILNIMLVSVTERTREIGIRKAIGATRRAIVQQFIIESLILGGLGGAIGIIAGIGLSVLGAILMPRFDPTLFTPSVSIPSVVLSFAISLTIGLIAGSYPANRAARLHPVDALRYE
ncbi:MAG TPA: ABC transporter permease [Nitrospiraceae bacterium]